MGRSSGSSARQFVEPSSGLVSHHSVQAMSSEATFEGFYAAQLDWARRLTFVTVMLGMVGAVAGVFGMNFETPYTQTGIVGFWIVLGALSAFIVAATILAQRRGWI